MLEKPDLPDATLISCLRADYGLHITELALLPIGADVNTAVYRAVSDDATPYFLKLRRGDFNETTVTVPWFLSTQGLGQVIAPIETSTNRLWTHVDTFAVILYPFVIGRTGFDAALADRHWVELGVALKGIHTAVVPHALRQHIPHETYSPHWRDSVRMFQARADVMTCEDSVAEALAAFLRTRREEISHLVERAEQLGTALQVRSPEHVLCHADIHGRNVLIGANDALHIVDWDTLIFAPKERDLMFICGGVGGIWNNAREEELFYQGYGQAEINPVALVYYRYERIVEDIAAFCEQLLLSAEGGTYREVSLRKLVDAFQPNNVVEIAHASDTLLRAG